MSPTKSYSPRLVAAFLLAATCAALHVEATQPEARLVNLSSRASVGAGSDVMIAGFVLGGSASKDVLIRAIGPTLGASGIVGALDQPRMQIFDSNGKVILTQDNWDPALKELFTRIGASALPDQSNDAAVRVTLPPGSYSVQVSGMHAPTGVALVEVYELDGTSRLMNLSTRAHVGAGEGILVSGLVISGGNTRRVLIRAAGPALRHYGVDGVLADPVLSLFDHTGVIVASNDNWGDGTYGSQISAAGTTTGAFPYDAGSKDSALLIDLAPGIYTMQVKGAANGEGVALLEVYDVSAATTGGTITGAINSGADTKPAPVDSGSPASNGGSTSTPPPDSLPAAPVTIPTGSYATSALSWAWTNTDARLGPTFAQLNSNLADDRPTLAGHESKTPPAKFYVRIKPYELGDTPADDSDYWSDSGQVAYVPDNPADAGLDRIQTFAYYNKVFAISPRLDYASGTPHSDPQTREGFYITMNGGPLTQPVAMVRNYAMQQNEEIVIYRSGLFAVAGTQTSRAGTERPYPGFKFPANKVPRAVAVTTSNEFALVTIWDTDRGVGQLAVVALEAKYLPFHTWPYMAMPNQGSFSDFKLLGYIDLPMTSPDAVAAASNGLWTGPSATAGKVLSQIDLSDDAQRQLVYNGDWQATVAKNGYAIVSSRADNKVAILDLTPLFNYVRESWLSSADSYQQTLAARGAAPDQFPQTFDVNPAIAPRIIWQAAVTKPTAVLAGQKIDRWSQDRFKAYAASEDGTLHIYDASPLMARYSWEKRGTLQEIGTVQIGRNPVNLCFTRFGEDGLPLIPNDSTGAQRAPDPLNNTLYAACRGERSLDAIVTWNGTGQVYRRIRDSRMGDPVAVGVASRGNIVTVADYQGKKLISFRIGTLKDLRNKVEYPPIDPSLKYEYAGQLTLPGSPFMVNSTNVN